MSRHTLTASAHADHEDMLNLGLAPTHAAPASISPSTTTPASR